MFPTIKKYKANIEHTGIIHEVEFEVAISKENTVIAIMPKTSMDYWSDLDNGVLDHKEEEVNFWDYSATIQSLLYEELEVMLLSDRLDCCFVIEQIFEEILLRE